MSLQISSNAPTVQKYIGYVHGAVLGICVVVSVIVAFSLFGLLFGICLSPPRRQPVNGKKRSSDCCSCNKSVGSHFLMSAAALTLLLFWLFLILVVILFLVGGLLETEACRHLTNYNKQPSSDVLALFDSWANKTLYDTMDMEVKVFNFYE